MNMTVPTSVVTKDQVKRTIASGWSIMKMPVAMTTQATASIGPRRSALGQEEPVDLEELEVDFTCAPPRR